MRFEGLLGSRGTVGTWEQCEYSLLTQCYSSSEQSPFESPLWVPYSTKTIPFKQFAELAIGGENALELVDAMRTP